MNEITNRQKELLELIVKSIRDTGFPPTMSEMAERLKVKSKNSITKLLKELESKGYLERDGSARGIKILDSLGESLQKGVASIPLLGEIPAGGPVLAEEYVEDWINLPTTLTKNRKNVFLLRVYGRSMEGVGIYEEDLVLIYPTKDVKVGEIAAALVDNEVTVKTIAQDKQGLYLKAENPHYRDIHPEGDWSIQGKVIGVIRQIN